MSSPTGLGVVVPSQTLYWRLLAVARKRGLQIEALQEKLSMKPLTTLMLVGS